MVGDVVVKLLRPEQARIALANDVALVGGRPGRDDLRIKLIRLGARLGERALEAAAEGERLRFPRREELEIDGDLAAGGDVQDVVQGRLGAGPGRVHRGALAVHDIAVERVLHVRRRVGGAEEALLVGIVLREQRHGLRAIGRGREPVFEVAERLVLHRDHAVARERELRLHLDVLARAAPGPEVAEPELRQQVQRGRRGAPVGDGQADERVIGAVFA